MAEALDDAIRDMLDIAYGWSRPMTDAEKLEAIRARGEAAIGSGFWPGVLRVGDVVDYEPGVPRPPSPPPPEDHKP